MYRRVFPILLLVTLVSGAILTEPDCELQCGNGACVSAFWRCDNVADCADGLDEANCSYLHQCKKGEFMCVSGECIPAEKKCDSVQNCHDGSDERGCPNKDIENLPSLDEFERIMGHSDISLTQIPTSAKIVRPSQCPQRNASLFITNNIGSIFRVRITDSLQKLTLFKENAGKGDMITSLTYNRDLEELLFTTKRFDTRILAINAQAEIRTFASRDNEHFGRIGVDPLTKNVYFADDGYGIGVCDKDAKNCLTLIPASTYQQRFSNLLFHTRRGTMIWVQDDPTPVVMIAGMDGKDSRHLSAFNQVHAIALDSENEMLYVADENAIIRMNLRTLSHVEYAKVRASDLFFFNCELYYVQRDIPSLRVITSQLEDKMVSSLGSSGVVFTIVSDEEKLNQTNPCLNLQCPELCVLTEGSIESGARCMCKVCREKEVVESGTWILSWTIIVLLVLIFLILVVLFLVIYFRLWPDLCDRLDNLLGFNRANNINFNFVNSEAVKKEDVDEFGTSLTVI